MIPTIVSITVQERKVSRKLIQNHSLNIQNPVSLTCEHIRLPAPTARVISSGEAPPAAITIWMPASRHACHGSGTDGNAQQGCNAPAQQQWRNRRVGQYFRQFLANTAVYQNLFKRSAGSDHQKQGNSGAHCSCRSVEQYTDFNKLTFGNKAFCPKNKSPSNTEIIMEIPGSPATFSQGYVSPAPGKFNSKMVERAIRTDGQGNQQTFWETGQCGRVDFTYFKQTCRRVGLDVF